MPKIPSPVLDGVVCDTGGVVVGSVDGVDDDGTDGITGVGTDGVTLTGTDGVTGTGTDGVTVAGTDGITGEVAGGVAAEGAVSTTGTPVLVVGPSCAGESLEAPPPSVVGVVTAGAGACTGTCTGTGTGAAIFETVDAAVAEPLSAPPPPQAASDVHSSVETTCTVTVREKSVISVSSISGRIGCVSGSSLSACQMP